MAVRTFQFLAVVLTALALVPAGAHLFALPNKIALPEEQYFVAQSLYRGWALLSVTWFAALAANLVLAVMVRDQLAACRFAALAAGCIVLSFAVFFLWTYPANIATGNWTETPAHWEALRRQWEYSHAANAFILFAALCAAMLSVLKTRA
jgi:hypothetical protein